MRTLSIMVGLAFLVAASSVEAQGLGQYQYKSRSNISVGRGGYSDVTSPGYSSRQYSGGRHDNHRHHGDHHRPYRHGNYGYGYPYYGGGWGGTSLSIGFGLPPAYGYGYGYGNPYGYGYSSLYPYGTYYRPGDQYLEYYLPPTEPAELNYGPQAMKQFMGLPRDFAIEPQRTGQFESLVTPLPSPLRIEAAKPVAIEQPSEQAIERAEHFIQAGDNLFQQQRYQEALGRYKDAVATAPGYAEAHLRKGLAYLATNRPDEAVDSIELAIQQNPEVAGTSLTLDALLGNNGLAKTSILETNARRAVTDPQNPEYLFCVAVLLYFNGDKDRALQCFQAARQAGGDADAIDAFEKYLLPTATAPAGLDI
ncbi:tetratricopeptide repeat protein [Bremerella alba]|uniref:tetratricopeptide repeat protein n=1 Tax=Bremerella alba TaxID=980252 RepID=UPI001A955A90|nr:tetratricopeptide repeat protein [Bremerella alba]